MNNAGYQEQFLPVNDKDYKFFGYNNHDYVSGICIEINGKITDKNCIFIFVKEKLCMPPSVSTDEFYIYIYDKINDKLTKSSLLYTSLDQVKYTFKNMKMYIHAKKYELSDSVDPQTTAFIPKYVGDYKKVFKLDPSNKAVFLISRK